jgi:hypothetical protein
METLLMQEAVVTISGQEFPYLRHWSDKPLLPMDGYLAFDTETEVVDLKRHIPQLALAAASTGPKASSLIHPDDLGRFVLAHKSLHIVCHHAAFDFWVVENHLRQRGEEAARRAWWDLAEQNRLHDSMLLDMLVRLARDDSYPDPRDLATVAKHYADLSIAKDDPYRLRYGEIIGANWDAVEEEFFTYAIKDAIVTRPAYLAIRKQGLALLEEFGRESGDIHPNARQRFGLLSEAIQVKKAIALAQITRTGMGMDLEGMRWTEADLRSSLQEAVASAQAICPVYKTDAEGRFHLSGKSQTPSFDDQLLRDQLGRIKEAIEQDAEIRFDIPRTKKGISRSVKIWADYAAHHPFLQYWIEAQSLAKLLQFFSQVQDRVDVADLAGHLRVDVAELAGALQLKLKEGGATLVSLAGLTQTITRRATQLRALDLNPDVVVAAAQALAGANRPTRMTVHPSYSVLVRTGRTSCSAPNIQQIPRDGTFRQAFVASPGHWLLAVDYSFIELVTFAATAIHRYGRSTMADIIKAGTDPHAYTASMMLGVPLEEFLSWKDNDTVVQAAAGDAPASGKLKDLFDRNRQASKPVNFGVIGGLGALRLVSYAHSTYKVDLTLEEATARREKLTKEIYPEMDLYLSEDGPAIVARNLRAPLWEVRNELDDTHLSSIYKILAGDPKRTDGKPYQPTFVSRVWASLAGLNRNPELTEALEKREPSAALAARVCHAGVATLTGRIRGHVRYSQARNTPFQGLAADGAALALFELVKQGFRVTGFVHDEILVELPDEGGYVSEATVQQVKSIMCAKMAEVLVGDIPVSCEAALSERWSKKAKLVVRDGKVYPWVPPAQYRPAS